MNTMKKLFIFFMNIITIHFIHTAALIPKHVQAKTSYYATKASEKILGQTLTDKLQRHAATGIDWLNWHLKPIVHPTQKELKLHGLWYGFKSGTTRSLYGDDPLHEMYKQYQIIKKHLQKDDSYKNNINKEALEDFHKAYTDHYLTQDEESKKIIREKIFKTFNEIFLPTPEEKAKPINTEEIKNEHSASSSYERKAKELDVLLLRKEEEKHPTTRFIASEDHFK